MKEFLQKLFDLLGIEASPDLSAEEALDLLKRRLEPLLAKMADDAVDEAVVAGKLAFDEREWGRGIAQANLAVFSSFVKHRKTVTHGEMAGAGRRRKTVVSDALQAAMNRQCGVTSEVFAKYNGAARS